MSDYRRVNVPNGMYFFTVVTFRRQKILCEPEIRESLRTAIKSVRENHPFVIDAWVLLPDHLHCLWKMPENDMDFAKRWAMIKRSVTKTCGARYYRDDWMNVSKKRRKESTLWQRRYWEHLIRDEEDLNRHRDYIHYNPVKHGLVNRVVDWPYSTFHGYVKRGVYSNQWGDNELFKDDQDDYGE